MSLFVIYYYSYIIVPFFFPTFIDSFNYKTADVIAIVAVLASIASILVMIGKYIYERLIITTKGISLKTYVKGNDVIIKCKVENSSRKRIIPQNVFAFIEAGTYNPESGLHGFPFLLKYEKNECDCNLAKYCQKGNLKTYPLELIDEKKHGLYRKIFKFRHLSHESVLFIDPGEIFDDSMALTLDKGVYRVMVVATFVNEGCMCATEIFII